MKKHSKYITYAASLFFGILFIFAAITIFGYGAAIAIPKSILEPLALFSPSLAFSLVDLITMGLPVACVFALFVWVTALLQVRAIPTLMAMPFTIFMLYSLIELLVGSENPLLYLTSSLAKMLPVVLCALFLAKRNTATNRI